MTEAPIKCHSERSEESAFPSLNANRKIGLPGAAPFGFKGAGLGLTCPPLGRLPPLSSSFRRVVGQFPITTNQTRSVIVD